MPERDVWHKLESALKGLAAAMVPVILAVAGYVANDHLDKQRQALEQQKLDQQMLERAVEVVFFAKDKERLFGNDASLESRRLYRAHWVETYNKYAKIKLNDDFIAIVMEQDTRPDGKRAITAADKPARESDQNSDGWVAVGRLEGKRPADLNFEIPSDAVAVDGAIKAGTMIRARWSVNLRKNTDNTEDKEHKLNPILGLMQAGQCAKVVKSVAQIRGQTWASIDVVPCSLASEKVASAAEPDRSASRPQSVP